MRECELIVGTSGQLQGLACLKVRPGTDRIRPGFIKSLRFRIGLVRARAREIPDSNGQGDEGNDR